MNISSARLDLLTGQNNESPICPWVTLLGCWFTTITVSSWIWAQQQGDSARAVQWLVRFCHRGMLRSAASLLRWGEKKYSCLSVRDRKEKAHVQVFWALWFILKWRAKKFWEQLKDFLHWWTEQLHQFFFQNLNVQTVSSQKHRRMRLISARLFLYWERSKRTEMPGRNSMAHNLSRIRVFQLSVSRTSDGTDAI